MKLMRVRYHNHFATLLAVSMMSLSGCNLLLDGADKVATMELPPNVARGVSAEFPFDAATVAAAFVDSLRMMGFVIATYEADTTRATIVGRSSDVKATVIIRANEGGCRARVGIGPMANQATEKRIVQAALIRLGME